MKQYDAVVMIPECRQAGKASYPAALQEIPAYDFCPADEEILARLMKERKG